MFSGGFTAKISFDSLKPVGGFSVILTAPTSNNNTNNYNIIIIIRTANTALKPCVSMILHKAQNMHKNHYEQNIRFSAQTKWIGKMTGWVNVQTVHGEEPEPK